MAGVILYSYVTSNIRHSIQEMIAQELTHANYLFEHLSEMKKQTCSAPEYEQEQNTCCPGDIYNERLFHLFNLIMNRRGVACHFLS